MLFEGDGRADYSEALVEAQQVKATILGHDEFKAYGQRIAGLFDTWREAHEPLLNGLEKPTSTPSPKTVVRTLSEDLLARFADLPLLNRYDVYQQLMDYWDEVMQDDVYLITADGWINATKPRSIIEDKEKKIRETPDLTIKRRKYKMDLIPPSLVVARYFTAERAAIEVLQARQEAATLELEEFIEKRTGEEGLLADAANDKGKVTKSGAKERLKAIQNESESDDERDALKSCLALIEAQAEASKAVKETEVTLDHRVLDHYATLTEAEIKTVSGRGQMVRQHPCRYRGRGAEAHQQLAERVIELEERYARPLPELEREVEEFSGKVESHLKMMGMVWE